jgi:predicted metal-dependent HD superfamily phosphohydrolase
MLLEKLQKHWNELTRSVCTNTDVTDAVFVELTASRSLLDADLAILNAEANQYWDYANAIRQEYAWVTDAEYRVGRQAVLEKFLQRWEQGTLYFSAMPKPRVEANLRREIEYLRTGAKIF